MCVCVYVCVLVCVMESFQTLGIPIDSLENVLLIDESVIKRAYRRMALKFHPDKVGNNESKRFHQIQIAYDSLMDPSKRVDLVNLARANLQRKAEFANKGAEKRKLAQELEAREKSETIKPPKPTRTNDSFQIRHRHLIMINEFNSSKHTSSKDNTLPDDSNTNIEYWLNFSMNETNRSEQQEKFKAFIQRELDKKK